MMLILAVDTSTKSGSFAIMHDNRVMAQMAMSSEDGYSSVLIRDVNVLLGQLRNSLDEMDLFAVVAGPGSFTGLRVGLTAVKAWAEVFGKPVAAVSGLEAIASQYLSAERTEIPTLLAPVLDARRGQVFGAIYRRRANGDGGLELLGEEVVTSVGEFLELVTHRSSGGIPIFVSPTPEVIAPSLAQNPLFRGARLAEISGVLAPSVGLLGYERAMRGEIVDALRLDANYVRRSDAELNWKGG